MSPGTATVPPVFVFAWSRFGGRRPTLVRAQVCESMSIIVRRNVKHAEKRSPQTLSRGKTTVACDLVQFVSGFFQPAPGCFNAQELDKPRWGRARLLEEHARKIARTHSHPCGKFFHWQVLTEIVERPTTNLFDLLPVG